MPDLFTPRAGRIDPILFGELLGAAIDAERAYRDALARDERNVARLEGIVEGLVRAAALVEGSNPARVRRHVEDRVEQERARTVEAARRGMARCREVLASSGPGGGNPVCA